MSEEITTQSRQAFQRIMGSSRFSGSNLTGYQDTDTNLEAAANRFEVRRENLPAVMMQNLWNRDQGSLAINTRNYVGVVFGGERKANDFVTRNASTIDRLSDRYDIDPRLLAAVAMFEVQYFSDPPLNQIDDVLRNIPVFRAAVPEGLGEAIEQRCFATAGPTNVNCQIWGPLLTPFGITEAQVRADPAKALEATAIIMSHIMESIQDIHFANDQERFAYAYTLYNRSNATSINEAGALVGTEMIARAETMLNAGRQVAEIRASQPVNMNGQEEPLNRLMQLAIAAPGDALRALGVVGQAQG